MPENSTLEMNGNKSTIVVTRETGRILGNINRIFLDRDRKRVSALSFRERYLGQEYFLNIDQIEAIGEDVVFVRPDTSPQILTKATTTATAATDHAPGEDLRNFQGMWVITTSGKPLAAITDLDFDRDDWRLVALFFCDHRAIRVDAADVTIGDSTIIVPDGTEQQIFDPHENRGLLAGVFGRAVVEEAAIVLQRALKIMTRPPGRHRADARSMPEDLDA